MSELIHVFTTEALQAFMHAAGYRAETVTDPAASITFLRSATNGLNFDIRMGNAIPGTKDAYSDAAFVAIFNIVGDLPLAPVNAWNSSRRFGRLQVDESVPDQKFLVLCMDVVVAGGVTPQYLRGQVEIWDGLVQQLVPWLRDELAKLHRANGVKPVTDVSSVEAAVQPESQGLPAHA
jgi:hypothetical protein